MKSSRLIFLLISLIITSCAILTTDEKKYSIQYECGEDKKFTNYFQSVPSEILKQRSMVESAKLHKFEHQTCNQIASSLWQSSLCNINKNRSKFTTVFWNPIFLLNSSHSSSLETRQHLSNFLVLSIMILFYLFTFPNLIDMAYHIP